MKQDHHSRELARLRLHHERVLDALEEAVVTTDSEGRIQSVNRAARALFDFSDAQSDAGTFLELLVGEPAPQSLTELIRPLGSAPHRLTLRRRSGSTFPADLTGFESDHGVECYVFVVRDLRADKAREDQLLHAQNMGLLGTLTTGLIHDFGHILQGIAHSLGILEAEALGNDILRDHVKATMHFVNRGADLVRRIRNFSRRDQELAAQMDPIPAVQEALQLLRSTIPRDIDVHTSLSSDGGLIALSQAEMCQIMLNLVVNSVHAMRGSGGALRISADSCDIHADEAPRRGVRAGQFFRLTIGDDGPGIAEDISHRIFEPFFTTKNPSEGTGLGLSIVRSIVAGHNGSISQHSSAGAGATFQILLPIVDARPAHVPVTHPVKLRGAGHVLLVEAEATQLTVKREMLKGLGYRVTAHRDGDPVLHDLDQLLIGIDALVADLAMPSLRGEILARRVRHIRPNIPVVLISKHADAAVKALQTADDRTRVLYEPLDQPSLGLALDILLRPPHRP